MKRKTAAVRIRAWSSRGAGPSAAKAAIDCSGLTAWLKPRPFKARSKDEVFSRLIDSRPSRNLLLEDFILISCSYLRRSADWTGCRHTRWGGVGHEGDYSAEDHDDQADPNPGN